ncbi:uncharacterized protein LOC133202415 [Saccostrea echinata]|uniref:uncharacterized protein LOC133202415 n=1 Tax=Saccostrea echinata TaxID=191078 RepID=UPI002A802EF9|nr:uncharacterized protein LOC133202415 [Saccostrea echinata]
MDEYHKAQSGEDESKNENKCSKKLFVISAFANVFFLGAITFLVAFQIVRGCDKRNDPPGSELSATQEDVFFSCSPCSPMMKAEDVDTMKYQIGNNSTVCCKRITTNVRLQVPNTGHLLQACRSKAGDNSSIGALLYINPDRYHKDESGLHWSQVNGSSYINGGIKYEDMMEYGKLIVPSDGIYVVYSYIQFDSYTGESTLDRTKSAMLSLFKNGKELVHLNKFTLRRFSYTSSQVGPILIPMKTGDSIHVAVSNAKIIYNNPRSSVFGIFKL